MVDDGLMKLDQITLAEIVRVVPHEMLKEFRSRQKGIADQTEKMISGKDLSRQTYMDDDENVIISDPAMEPKIIARLYDLYSKEKREMGIASGKSELSYFKEFISDSYKKICDKFNCSKVKFYLDRDHDSVKICAEPVE
jgi:hypothetical protein